MKVFLIAYCNLSTITIHQLNFISEKNIELSFLAIFILIFYVIGFPIYIYKLLSFNRNLLYNYKFKKKFGSLYLSFKPTLLQNKFMILILFKQFLYSILINISEKLTFLQNSLLLGTNVIYLLLVIIFKPYVKSLFQLQALIMSISTILISSINYLFIIKDLNKDILYVFGLVSSIVHIGTIFTFIILQIINFCHKKRKLFVIKKIIDGIEVNEENKEIEMRDINNLSNSDLDPNYLKSSSKRLQKKYLIKIL